MEVPKITISGGVLIKNKINIICQVFIAKYTQKHWKNGNFWSENTVNSVPSSVQTPAPSLVHCEFCSKQCTAVETEAGIWIWIWGCRDTRSWGMSSM